MTYDALLRTMPASVEELPTPMLLVDVDRVDHNVRDMADRFATAGVRLRPHVKTSKCWNVAQRQLAAGAIGFTCSTAAEVVWLQERGVSDLLWAHLPVGPRKVEFAVAAAARGGLTVSLDSLDAARPLSDAAAAADVVLPFVLEVNTGHARTGVEPDAAGQRARELAALPGLRLRGVLTHEGHLAAQRDRAALEQAGTAAGTLLGEIAERLRAEGHDLDLVSVGSTPGATSAPFAPGVTEGRPGTYVYYDANQVRLGSVSPDRCALSVLARVVSVQRDGRAIIDAGIKAMSSDSIAAAGSLGVACDRALKPVPDVEFTDGNEEHGFLTGEGAATLSVGDLLRVVPNHACGTTNMWSHVVATRDQAIVDDWSISARY